MKEIDERLFNIRRDMCPIASEKNGRIEDIIAENVGGDTKNNY